MQNISAKYIDSRITALAAYQLIGGIIGLYYLVSLIMSAGRIPPLLVMIVALGLACYLFSVFCGIFLFKDRVLGTRLSLVNQLLQVLSFSLFGYGYEYVAGISTTVNIDFLPTYSVSLNSGLSNWYALLNGEGDIRRISINLVAIFLVFFISRLQRRIHQQALEEVEFDEPENTTTQ
jgi:hypothetical protein